MKSPLGASAQEALKQAAMEGKLEKESSLMGVRSEDSITDALKKKTKTVHIKCSYCDGYDEVVPLEENRKQHDLLFGDNKEFRLLCGTCFMKICDKALGKPKNEQRVICLE